MDGGRERGSLSIPSFASERCRSMTAELLRALEGIPPTDDKALEDRALACFVVACGELALMSNSVQRDAVVDQLTAVARKLVNSTLAALGPQAAPAAPAPVASAPVAPVPAQEQGQDRPGELAPHVGMTWEELEAVLKKQKADREGGR
jgi:hypothetical protein